MIRHEFSTSKYVSNEPPLAVFCIISILVIEEHSAVIPNFLCIMHPFTNRQCWEYLSFFALNLVESLKKKVQRMDEDT